MVVKDLSKSFNPCPKNAKIENKKHTAKNTGVKNIKKTLPKDIITDFCIMPKNNSYSTKRTKKYCERHEAFFSRAYRNKSIKDGLIVFLTEEDHRGTNGVHGKNGDKLNRKLKKIAQKAWMDYYHKTKEEFQERYGQNCL